MAKKLSLRLNYKGKFLDYAKEGADFKNRFFIGSNKYLQWQILDSSFPDKHLFITKKGSDFVMQLLPNTQLSCSKDGSLVDVNYLKQNGILKGNELLLKPNMSGNLDLSPDWQINYEFREPWVNVLTAEEKQIVAQYARKPELDAADRFNRATLIIATAAAMLFIVIFNLTYKPPVTFDDTIEGTLAAIRNEAQKVTAKMEENASSFQPEEAPVPEDKAKDGATGKPGATDGAPTGPKGLSFGGVNADPNSDIQSSFKIGLVTTAEGFAVGKRSGQGSGSGSGNGSSGGASGGLGSSADPEDIFGNTGSVAERGPSGRGMTVAPGSGNFKHYTGDASKMIAPGIAFGDAAAIRKMEDEFRRKKIATVTGSQINALAEDERMNYTGVKDQVKAKQPQIEQVYKTLNANFDVSLEITIWIGANGKVLESKIIPKNEVPQSFLEKVKSTVDNWTFKVSSEAAFNFPVRIRK